MQVIYHRLTSLLSISHQQQAYMTNYQRKNQKIWRVMTRKMSIINLKFISQLFRNCRLELNWFIVNKINKLCLLLRDILLLRLWMRIKKRQVLLKWVWLSLSHNVWRCRNLRFNINKKKVIRKLKNYRILLKSLVLDLEVKLLLSLIVCLRTQVSW
jgi:hypothetical protein